MSLALNRSDRRPLLVGGGIFLVLIVLGLLVSPPTDQELPTSYSAASGGTKAAFLLLEALGYQTHRWERPPVDLSEPQATTVIVAEPTDVQEGDREALLRFVDAGGLLVVTGQTGATLVGLTGRAQPAMALGWAAASAVALSPITRAAPVITLAPGSRLAPLASGRPIYAMGDLPVVVHVRRNKGDIYWWSSSTPMTSSPSA